MTDEELIARLRGEPKWSGLVALTKQAADRIEQLLNLNEALVELMDDRDAKLAKAVEQCEIMLRLRGHDEVSAIEQLTEQLAAARHDAKEAEAYAEELEKGLNTCRMAQAVLDNTVADLEAKLARADWLLTDAAVQLEEGKIKTRRNRAGLIWQFLAEIKGESHDPL